MNSRRITGLGITGWPLATLALVALVFSAVLAWEWRKTITHGEELQAEAARQAEADLRSLLVLEAQPISGFCTTFSWWDELCQAIAGHDTVWLAANIDPAREQHDLYRIGIFDLKGGLVHEAGGPSALMASISAGLAADMLRSRTGSTTLPTPDGVFDLAWSTVHLTTDTARRLPPHGLLVAARAWSPDRLQRISTFFGGQVTLGHGSDPDADLRITHELTAPAGQSSTILVGERRLPVLSTMAQRALHSLYLFLGFGCVALVAIGLAIVIRVGSPLRRLAGALSDGDAEVIRRLARRRDELGLVAEAGLAGLNQRSQLVAEISRRELAERDSEDNRTQLAKELAERSARENARQAAEMRTALALQGGNLCLWDYDILADAWRLDHEWLCYQGVLLDPTLPETKAWNAAVDPEDLPALRNLISNAGLSEGALEISFRMKRDDGSTLWILLRGTISELDRDGKPVHLAGTMLDVTRWRELEQQLRHAQKLESIGQLAAGIAHEINTPIQFIGDNTRFAVDSFAALQRLVADYHTVLARHPDETDAVGAAQERADLAYLTIEIPKALQQTLEGVERVAGIVRAMKEFAHPTAGELLPVDLNHLVRNAVTISCNTWKYVADLDLDLDTGLGPVPLSVGDFNSVLLNLVVNAAQAIEDANDKGMRTGKGQGRIRIATHRDGEQAVLTVEDDGCGIPPEIIGRIYDPFFTTKPVGRGSGQGLSITRSVVVDKHRGTISCASTPGQGATFTIRLPLRQEANHDNH
jgi:signal transduction histidine kinase